MTIFQKEQVRRMRSEGKSYSKIAVCLGISENTIKSYSQRNNLGGMNAISRAEQVNIGKESFDYCKNCSKSIEQRHGRKPRKFCSDECRKAWWNSHMNLVSQKSIYHLECVIMGLRHDTRKPRTGLKKFKSCAKPARIREQIDSFIETLKLNDSVLTEFDERLCF